MTFTYRVTMYAVLVLVVAACGDDKPGEEASDGVRRIEISAAEFHFTPDLVTVSPGETVEFVVTNDGDIDHEFRVTDQAGIDAHIEGGHEEHGGGDMDDMSDDGDMGDMGEAGMDSGMLTLAPGSVMTLTVTFPDNPEELTRFVCLIPGHYEAGMVGDIRYSS
ncbi:MAG: plastocyanin/azurin family copper-binding protein [Acidimicrobiia bacterium]